MSSKHRSKRREPKHQPWSEWTWNETYRRYVRCRDNSAFAGGVEWEYGSGTIPESDYYNSVSTEGPSDIQDQNQIQYRTPKSDVPRYTPPTNSQVEQPRQTSDSPPESYTYRRDDDDFVEELSRRFEDTELSEHASYSDDKGKQPVYSTSWQPNANSPPFPSQQLSMYPQYAQGNPHPGQNYYPPAQGYPQGNAQLGYIQEDVQNRGVEPFASQLPGASYQGSDSRNSSNSNPYSNYNSQQYGYEATSVRDPEYIAGSDNLPEDLHPDFKLHYSKEFKFMKVFKMVWHETRGENNTFGTDTIYGKFKQPVNASIRRFVIIKAEKGHCLCLPILTYNKQGTTKRGLIVDHHGIIYTGKHEPGLQPGEQPLNKPSVRMIPKKDKDRLHAASRINYAKIYTVEHNVKCVFIGSIDDPHRERVVEEYNKTVQI